MTAAFANFGVPSDVDDDHGFMVENRNWLFDIQKAAQATGMFNTT